MEDLGAICTYCYVRIKYDIKLIKSLIERKAKYVRVGRQPTHISHR